MTTALDLAALLDSLEAMPRELQSAALRMTAEAALAGRADGGFSLVEHAWHLADLEREGFGARIRRLLAEKDPMLPDFDGARIAAERNYRERSLAEGVAAFLAARTANVALLRSLPDGAWGRPGRQEGVGPLFLRDVPRLMREHDDSHRAEIAALLAGTSRPRESMSA
jgi:hypothetical protein